MIRVQNVSKIYPTRFGKKLVLDDISFELRKGEKLGILGRNGAGKSTLIRLLGGAEFPTSGKITTDMSVSWPLAFGGGFQDNLTGVDNIRFLSRVYDQDFQTNLAFVEEFSELGEYLREEVRTYSSGMRARLAFAISMIIEFDCFLIDEVSAVGDARFHARCNFELFEKRSDRAMVIVSHNTSYVRNHCNRFALLDGGKLRFSDDFEEIFSDFRTRIGLAEKQSEKRPKSKIAARSRKQLISVTDTTAIHDEQFLNLVLEAHLRTEEKNWSAAIAAYDKALKLYPFHAVYWTQWAHVVKESGDFELAEIGYRTACALGESVGEIKEFFDPVMRKLGRFPVKAALTGLSSGPTFQQPPSIPDLALFGRLAWHSNEIERSDMISTLRESVDCDTLLAGMIRNERFLRAHGSRLADYNSLEPKQTLVGSIAGPREREEPELWATNLTSVVGVGKSEREVLGIAQSMRRVEDALSVLLSHGGFSDWPQTHAALKDRLSNAGRPRLHLGEAS
jgi:ABC-type polysaccharide/polyol phosphate transport system ATPase subunit